MKKDNKHRNPWIFPKNDQKSKLRHTHTKKARVNPEFD